MAASMPVSESAPHLTLYIGQKYGNLVNVEYLETGNREMRGDTLIDTVHVLGFVIFGVVDAHRAKKKGLVSCIEGVVPRLACGGRSRLDGWCAPAILADKRSYPVRLYSRIFVQIIDQHASIVDTLY